MGCNTLFTLITVVIMESGNGWRWWWGQRGGAAAGMAAREASQSNAVVTAFLTRLDVFFFRGIKL
jgi:hypothetical protein